MDRGQPFLEKREQVLRIGIRIEELRLARWPKIDDEFRSLIEKPFPVIYGIEHEGPVLKVNCSPCDEVGIKDGVPIEALTIYVPRKRIELTRALSAKFTPGPEIKGIFDLRSEIKEERKVRSPKSYKDYRRKRLWEIIKLHWEI